VPHSQLPNPDAAFEFPDKSKKFPCSEGIVDAAINGRIASA
jgi:hypothetical protein